MSTTCHICKITFQRMTSLSLHLDNAHCPPVCWMCSQSFSNVWDLNKHAEEPCLGSANERSALASDVECQWGRPLDSDDASTDASTSNTSEDDNDFEADQSELNDTHSSSAQPTDFADNPGRGPPTAPAKKDTICKACGRGPFRSIKLHQRHCISLSGKTFQCSRCTILFPNEAALKEHHIILYTCDTCGQVFSNLDQHRQHHPPNLGRIRLICFCSESMPKVCAICKSFFVSEKFLLAHITKVHASVVTKSCIVNKPPGLTDNNVCAESTLKPVKQVTNGQLPTDHTYSFSAEVQTSHLDPSRSAPLPTILALFENQSQKLASIERTNTHRHSRVLRTCRQCGTVLRQPSLAISHRYLHRGRRSHRCQCGRAFKHRLHLLRHCVQHAEAKSYICVNCGNTFAGARLLAKHLRGKTWKKKKCRGKCKMPLACSCGYVFYRASAYIWHQIKNNENQTF
ncbi:uncharacterized protein LOC144058374 [Vanacampus margaritifer]